MKLESLDKWSSEVALSLSRRDRGLFVVAGLAAQTAPVMSSVREAFEKTGEPFHDIETYQDVGALQEGRYSLNARMALWNLGMYPRQGVLLDQYMPVSAAIALSYGHTVVMAAHLLTRKDVFRRFGREHPLDLEMIRGIYSVSRVRDDGTMGVVIEDMRFYQSEDDVPTAAEVELKHGYRFSIRRAMEQVESGKLQIANVIARFGEFSVKNYGRPLTAA